MSARQNKKRKGRNHVNNRERTVTTFTEDPNTSFLVPLPSEDPPASLPAPFSAPAFSMPYQNYIAPQQQQFYQPVLPPGKNDLEILENLKTIIKEGQHEFYRAVPQPAALASLYLGHIPQAQVHTDQLPPEYPRFSSADNTNGPDTAPQSLTNTVEPHTPLSGVDTSPTKLSAETLNVPEPNTALVQPESEDPPRATTQGPPVDTMDTAGEYGARQPADTATPNKATPFDATNDDEPPQPAGEDTWNHRALDDSKVRYDDRNTNLSPNRAATSDNRPQNSPTTDNHFTPEDRRFYDRDRDRDQWDRDRDRHDFRDRNRDRDIRDRRPEFFGRSYGRSHAPRPPPELRHYEPSYGDDYVLPPRRYDLDDRRGSFRNGSLDDRSKPLPSDDRRLPSDDRRPPLSSDTDDRRLPLDDRPMRRVSSSDTRTLPPVSDDRARPGTDSIPLTRAEDDRSARAPSLTADDRPRVNVSLEERLSQPTPTPSLQDRLSQPAPARVDIASAPSLEERLSSGPVPSRPYQRSASVARDDLRPPLPKDDLRDHDRMNNFRTNRDFTRERPTASTYRPDLDRSFGDRDDRDRRDRDVTGVDVPPARYGDAFGRVGPPPLRRFSPPPMFDRDRERERGRGYYPPRSPPPFRGEGVYDPDGDRRYAPDRDRDTYDQRRRDWYGPGDDDKRGPPPPPSASWRPHDRQSFMDRDKERFDRERDRDRDIRDRDRDRERDRELSGFVPPPPPTRGHWDDRDRRIGFPLSPPPPPSRMDTTGGVGPGRSLSARLTDPYPPPGGDDRAYPPPRDFDRGRYGGPALDDRGHGHAPPPAFSRIRNRSPSPPRRAPGLADDLRPPVKRMREDSGTGYPSVGLGVGSSAYSPPRRGVGVGVGGGGGGGGEYAPGPPPSSAATTTTTGMGSISGTVPARSTGTRTPPVPVSAPLPNSGAGSGFYERDQRERERERERDRDREYVRSEYGMGYDRDDRGRRSPPMLGSRIGGGGGAYGRGVVGDRRDDRRYVPPPPPRTS